MIPERFLQCLEGFSDISRARPTGIDLLQRDHVGGMTPDQRDYALQIEAWITATSAMDIPSHDAHGRAGVRDQDERFRRRPISFCAIQAMENQATRASKSCMTLIKDMSVNTVTIPWPSSEATSRPGSIPIMVPAT